MQLIMNVIVSHKMVKIRSKKGIQLTMQLIVVVIILLVLLVFLLVFFTGQGGKLSDMWNSLVGGAINQTAAATK